MTSGAAPSLVLPGGPHLQVGDARADLPDKLPGYLVAYLASRGDWVLREELAALPWPQATEAEAQNNLRVNLARLRPRLADWGLHEHFVAERRRLRLDVSSDVGALRAAHARADLAAAAAAAGAPFLDGLSFRAFAVLGEWARTERETLRQLWRDALLRAAQGAPPQARLDLSVCSLQADPFDEDLLRLQLDALAELGRGAEAQRVYAEFDVRARSELGVGASPALAEHARRLAPDDLRLAPRAGNDAADPLIGREAELARLEQQLQQTRLVVVVGLGGSGKTRLARAAQSRLSGRFETSLWLAPGDSGSVDELVHRVADGLRCTLGAGDAVAALAAHIGQRPLLLLVDGAEQLVADADRLQRLLDRLLDACPGLGVVLASREPLGRPRAALLRLGGLPLPAPEGARAALAADAVRLFVHEAQRVRAGFDPRSATAELVAIAHATGGLPLALRIAAGWMHSCPVPTSRQRSRASSRSRTRTTATAPAMARGFAPCWPTPGAGSRRRSRTR